MIEVLVVYYSRKGATESLAREVCHGVDSVSGATARLRTVPAVSTVAEATQEPVPVKGPPYASVDTAVKQAMGGFAVARTALHRKSMNKRKTP